MMANRNNNNCCVEGCRNKQKDSKLSFFTLPRDFKRRVEWLKVIGRPDLLNKTNLKETSYRVCSKHFERSAISELIVRKLKPGALPTKYLPNQAETSVVQYEAEAGIADASTQTDFTYGYQLPKAVAPVVEKDIFVEVDGRTVLIKREKNPISTVFPEMTFFSTGLNIKKEPLTEVEEPVVKKKKE